MEECHVEMEMVPIIQIVGGERKQDKLVQSQGQVQVEMPQPEEIEIGTKIEQLVGVQCLKNLPDSLKLEGPSSKNYSLLIQSIGAKEWERNDSPSKNQLTILFCSPAPDSKTGVVKELIDAFKRATSKSESNPSPLPQYKIIILDAQNPHDLKLSFEKVAETHLPKIQRDTDHFPNEKAVNEIYEEMRREIGPKYKSLYVFVGAGSLSEIQQFLPQGKLVLPSSHFLVTTSSKTFHWESESESESVDQWSIERYLMFDKNLYKFDWEGVHSTSKLPRSFQPVSDFAGRDNVLSQLAQRVQNVLVSPNTKAQRSRHKDGCRCQRQAKEERKEFCSSRKFTPKPAPVPSSSLTVITGLQNIGKTELLKKYLTLPPHPFSTVVLFNATNPRLSLKVFAYNSGIYSEREIEGATESDKFSFLQSQIIKDFQDNSKIIFVFDYAAGLEHIKEFLSPNSKEGGVIPDFHVIVTSRNRSWAKEEDLNFYRDNHFDFKEIFLFDGLNLEETHLFFSKLLPQNGMLYRRAEVGRGIKEFHKLTDGFPKCLQRVRTSISESSESNPEWTPKLHILNYLSGGFGNFGAGADTWLVASSIKKDFLKNPQDAAPILLDIMCLMDTQHLLVDLILSCFNSCITDAATVTAEQIDQWLRHLELDCLIQVDRKDSEEGGLDKLERIPIRIPAFLRERVRFYQTPSCPGVYKTMRSILSGATPLCSSSNSSWKMPLHDPRLLPHILSFNESHNIYHGYYNEFLIQCIQTHLKFFPTTSLSQRLERDKIKQVLELEDPDFKGAFGEFPKLKKREFVSPILFLVLFLVDIGSDFYNSLIILRAGYTSYFCLALFLVIAPFSWLCLLHKIDRATYNAELKSGHPTGRDDYWKTFFGTLHSYFSQLWYTWKFKRETENLERGLLYERLCVLRANTEIQGIAEGFMESLPQLLLQFPLYLLSYTEEYSELRDVMQGSLIPFELSLVVNLLSLGLALTKLESIYFGWNVDLFGIKLLGYRSIHFLLNVMHTATLVFCSGMVSMVFPPLIFIIPLAFCLTAAAWILSNTKDYRGRTAKSSYLFYGTLSRSCSEPHLLSPNVTCSELVVFFASFHPGFVNEAQNLEVATKHEFVSGRLGHDLLFLQRRPKRSDLIYLFLFLSSILISTSTVLYSTFYEERLDKSTKKKTDLTELFWPFRVIRENSFYFILWLPLLFAWQVLRQLLNFAYVKYAKDSPLTEDYILNDPEGIIRYPVSSDRWIQRRLYYQMRPNQPGVFGQTWEQVKESVSSVKGRATFWIENLMEESWREILGTLLWIWIKVIFKAFYFLFLIFALCLVPHTLTLLNMDWPSLSSNSLYRNDSLFA